MRQLPPPIMTSEPGSFAQRTITERKPRIIDRVVATNAYPHATRARLAALQDELDSGLVAAPCPIGDPAGLWRGAWSRWEGCTWLQLPWFFAEAYFYQRLLEAVHYYHQGPWHQHDPFALDKAEALHRALDSLQPEPTTGHDPIAFLRALLLRALWGNQTDLSNQDVAAARPAARPAAPGTGSSRLLIDHSLLLATQFFGGKVQRLHIVCDNAGPELVADLILLHHLVSAGLVDHVSLHLKATPFFVSDALPSDLEYTTQTLRRSSSAHLATLGAEITALLESGQLQAHADPFWTSSLGFNQMPPDLMAALGQADLVLFKGDANYRRLLNDRHWATTDALEEITSYLPFSYACLRTLKAELVVGLPQGLAKSVAERDPEWLTSGRWGLIHSVIRP